LVVVIPVTMTAKEIEKQKLELEARRIELDAELRRAELADKEAQRTADREKTRLENERAIAEHESASGRGFRFTASQATVAAAVLALIGGVIGALISGIFSRDALIEAERIKANGAVEVDRQRQAAEENLKRIEFETSLIMKAIDTPNRDDQIRNLLFFVNAGFITDHDGKIGKMDLVDLPSAVASPTTCTTTLAQFSPTLVEFLQRLEGEAPDPCVLGRIQVALRDLVKVQLNENQLSALTAFAYNVGLWKLSDSNLLKVVNAGNFSDVGTEFIKWNKAAGRVFPGLTARREAEAALFAMPPVTSTSRVDTPGGLQ
jgi:GH24 family phage-related lysozyme (muramidase)